ncbi:MAG: tRNA uridine-5-carboxymethylaminomethyl(34) synthesis GTPase MnmE [Verrucomicrobiales bacterium]
MKSDTIAAISTAFGQGAIAVLRISGPGAVAVAGRVCHGKVRVEGMAPRQATLAEVRGEGGERIDEVLVTVFPKPASYTGEDVVEISCHGGVLVSQLVYACLLEAGARAAEPGEFTQRAFLNGKMDLTQAEAVMDLIEARTSLALKAAAEQLEGRLGREMEVLRQSLLGVVAHVEAYIDFPDEDIDPDTGAAMRARVGEVFEVIERMLATADQGRILREGVRTVICGEPNVGKSSLLNRLLGCDRAIVSEVAGTTRDTIEEVINLRGIPLRLVDTAGVREALDLVEREGIARTERQIEGAELVLEVVDGSHPVPKEFASLAAGAGKKHLLILNKEDLGTHDSWGAFTDRATSLSCTEGTGAEALQTRIYDLVTSGEADWAANPVAINARHQACLARALTHAGAALALLEGGEAEEIAALELRSSLDAVGEVVGVTEVEEILGEIFASFCIGK